jgi:DNA-directed RNA polymerase specialized sigma24 family protein
MATRTDPRARMTRLRKSHLQLADPGCEDPAMLVDRALLREIVAAGVNGLSDPLMRSVLILIYQGDNSLKDAAKILKHDVGRLRCLEAKALRLLRVRLQRYDPSIWDE